MKVNQLYFSIIIGLSQGSQPIESFNYGAKQYKRVKDAFLLAASVGAVVSSISYLLFQLFPRQILGLFRKRKRRIFWVRCQLFPSLPVLHLVKLFCSQSPRCFSVPSEKRTRELSSPLTRQILFLLPLIVALPHFFGIMGVLYAGPIADLLSFAVGLSMVIVEFKHINKLEAELA